MGANVGTSDPFLQFVNPSFADINGGEPLYTNGGNPLDKKSGCAVNGRPILGGTMYGTGSTRQRPHDCGSASNDTA